MNSLQKVELLAPAGSFEALYSAIENGADAVYLGLKKFNARNYAKNFELEDIPYILDYAHSKGKKIYITINTLIKENEIKEVFEILEKLNKFKVDAVIFQDLSIIKLVKKYFPELNLHASTQLTNINSYDVKFLEDYVKRVILERQIFIDEIKRIVGNSKVEIECFIHGALCYSISGRCLFSSYLGGQSGNRGRCTQPCRRLYYYKRNKGYYFSTNDMEAVYILEDLIKIGVNAFKIEGRMKSAQYVGSVVKAYRILIDDYYSIGKISDFAKLEAKSFIKDSFGRKTTLAFFVKPLPQIVEPKLSGNTGLYIGKIIEKSNRYLKFKTLHEVEVYDRIRVQSLNEDEKRVSFRIRKIFNINGKEIKRANKGDIIVIPVEKKFEVKKGDLVFKTQSVRTRIKLKDEESVINMIKKSYKFLIPVFIKGEFDGNSLLFSYKDKLFRYNVPLYSAEKTKLTKDVIEKYFKPKFTKNNLDLDIEFNECRIVVPQKELKKIGEDLAEKIKKIVNEEKIEPEVELDEIIKIPKEKEFYFKMPSMTDIVLFPDNFSDNIILPVHSHVEEIYGKFEKKFKKLIDRVIFCIDDILSEEKLDFYRKKIEFLKSKGFYKFFLNSKAEFIFFRDNLNYFLVASSNFHVTNSVSMEFLKEIGFSKIVLYIENDKKNLRKFFFKIDTIIPVFSYIKLMVSRIPNTIEKSTKLSDLRKKENLYFKVSKDSFELYHLEPFTITNHIEELYFMGYRNFLFDISNYLKYRNNLPAIIRNFKKGISPVKGRDFNYTHEWV